MDGASYTFTPSFNPFTTPDEDTLDADAERRTLDP